MKEKRISFCQGKGSLTHNNRDFIAENVDPARIRDNYTFIKKDLGTVYEHLFGESTERYNAKQKRNDRKIKGSYFESLFHQKPSNTVVTAADKRKSFYEDVVQMYFNLDTQLDALKKLNDDFTLGLSLDKSQNKLSQLDRSSGSNESEYIKRKREKEQYEQWEKSAWKTLRDRFRLMREYKEKYPPKSAYENLDPRFVTACHYLEHAEYVLEEFMDTPYDKRKQFEDEVDSAKEFLNKWLNYCPEIKPMPKNIKTEETSVELLPKFTKIREETEIDDLLKRRIV